MPWQPTAWWASRVLECWGSSDGVSMPTSLTPSSARHSMGGRSDSAEAFRPVRRDPFEGPQQHPRGQVVELAGEVFGGHQRVSADTVDHPARSHVDVQRHLADGQAVGAVVQGAVDVGAGMRRKGDPADVDRALLVQPRRPFLLERRVAGPGRRARVEGGTDVPVAERSHCFSPEIQRMIMNEISENFRAKCKVAWQSVRTKFEDSYSF
ncbi:Uncharacterised protein [Pseudomonas aeruginosa]|nr:Uncharacterised protein [Pseudomonas aeruginosa]